jgi:hypothetical protein
VDLYDGDGEHIGCVLEGRAFQSIDPPKVHTVTLTRAGLTVPQPGLYDLVLSFNGEEARRWQLWVLPQRR